MAKSTSEKESHTLIKKGKMEKVKKLIHIERARKLGLTGKNITIAIMDTGIYPHPDFTNRVIGFKDFCQKKLAAYDDNGHGTHISGIAAGSGVQARLHYMGDLSGIAPRANILMVKVLDAQGNGSASHMIEAIDWITKVKEKYNIKILNISVGMLPNSGREEQQELLNAVEYLWDIGIVVVAAAGNNGPREQSITIPGISRKILTVGSSDDEGGIVRQKGLEIGYSGKGPTKCCILKPEILAPGTNIMSCKNRGKGYTQKSGTSMAAPTVSGAIALLLEKYPNFTPQQIKLRFYERAYPRGEQIGKKSWGVLHIDNLIRNK